MQPARTPAFTTTYLPLSVAMVPSSPNRDVYDTSDRREVPIPKQQSNRFPNKQIPEQTDSRTNRFPNKQIPEQTDSRTNRFPNTQKTTLKKVPVHIHSRHLFLFHICTFE